MAEPEEESETEKGDEIVTSLIPLVEEIQEIKTTEGTEKISGTENGEGIEETEIIKLPFKRIQSPSSINTFKQCPRKYYYQYILKLETLPSIHLIRGTIAHAALEDFFKTDSTHVHTEHFQFELKVILMEQFRRHWRNAKDEFAKLALSQDQLLFYYKETVVMLENWFNRFSNKMQTDLKTFSMQDSFKRNTPLTEAPFMSDRHGVRGIIDAVHEIDGKVTIMDYKTSNKSSISEDYKLQLAIYALLYNEKYGKLPDRVGIDFLKFDEKHLDVDEKLVQFAAREIACIHELTQSIEIQDYNRKKSPLCKWSTGKCDFYDTCKPHG